MSWDGLPITDADLAAMVEGDWLRLARASLLAAGRDGVITQASPWVLTSASNDFEAQGLLPGHVLVLADLAGSTDSPLAAFGSLLLGIASVAGHNVTLAPLSGTAGMAPGVPGDLADLRFWSGTLQRSIELAAGAVFASLTRSDAMATALTVLCNVYTARAVGIQDGSTEYAEKGERFCRQARERLDELTEDEDAQETAKAIAGRRPIRSVQLISTMLNEPATGYWNHQDPGGYCPLDRKINRDRGIG